MSVHGKLMHVRCDLMRTKLEKSGINKFAGYRYFELGDFMPATMDLFLKHKLCGVVSFTNEYATLQITDIDDGTMIVITSPMATASLKGAHDIQNLGAVESYQRRYLWMTALELTESDPIDSAPPVEKKPEEKPVIKIDSAPKKIVGQPGEYQIVIDPIPEGSDITEWLNLVRDASYILLDTCANQEDVMMIFKKNKVLFDTVKAADAIFFKEMMVRFTEVKTKLKKD